MSDYGQSMASPADVIPALGSPARDARRVADWARQQHADGIVVGLPLNMDGTAGPQARLARAFARRLRALVDLPVRLFDERLTSFEAEALMSDACVPPRRRARLRDAFAAHVILRGFLDSRADRP